MGNGLESNIGSFGGSSGSGVGGANGVDASGGTGGAEQCGGTHYEADPTPLDMFIMQDKSSSMVSVDVPGASALSTGGDDSTGRWRVRDLSGEVFLEVRYNNGNVRRMPITEDNRNWYLNGEKAFAVDP